MKELEFSYKKRIRAAKEVDFDVCLSISFRKDGSDGASIIFYNGSEKKISNTDYVVYAIDGDRLYFKGEESSLMGWKLTKNNNSRKLYIVNDALLHFASKNRGYYNLSYDKERELYYIDCEEVRWCGKGVIGK